MVMLDLLAVAFSSNNRKSLILLNDQCQKFWYNIYLKEKNQVNVANCDSSMFSVQVYYICTSLMTFWYHVL